MNRFVRVLFLTHYTQLLGANRSLLALLERLPQYGVEPLVLCPDSGELTERLDDLHVFYRVERFHAGVHVNRGLSFGKSIFRQFDNFIAYTMLKATVADLKPDVIYTNTLVLHVGARLARDLSLPHVWHVRELGLSQYDLRYDFGESHARKHLRRAAAMIAISEAVRKKVVEPLGIANAHTVYNGVMSERRISELRQEPAPRNAYPTFCLVGLFHPSKRQVDAVQAMRLVADRFPEAVLQLVGYGEKGYAERIRDEVVRLDLKNNVLFTGYLKDPLDTFRQADAALMCSHEEAMGRVTAEAMACGTPVIGYAGGATPELVEDGRDGYLYRTVEELSERMLAVAQDRERAKQMGRAGQEKAARLFTVERYAEQVHEILRSVAV